jgi:hypothetical protein
VSLVMVLRVIENHIRELRYPVIGCFWRLENGLVEHSST